jgi:uncharacterized membrane protein
METRARFPIAPGFLIGVAVTGFFDGILLHRLADDKALRIDSSAPVTS